MEISPIDYNFETVMNILTKKKFFVKVPRIYIYSEAEKEIFGIPMDIVNGEPDKKSIMELVDSYKNTYELAQIAYENNSIIIKNEDDILEIIEIANQALNILRQMPNKEFYNNEDLSFSLETLIEKIKETHKDYLKTLYDRKDEVKNYIKETYDFFLKIKNSSTTTPEITAVKNEINDNDMVFGMTDIDFSKISL